MRKGIATSTVIAIILGIVVLGLIGFWLFRLFTNIGTQVSLDDCKQFVQTRFCPYMKTDPDLYSSDDKAKTAFSDYCGNSELSKSEQDFCKSCKTYLATLWVDTRLHILATCQITG